MKQTSSKIFMWILALAVIVSSQACSASTTQTSTATIAPTQTQTLQKESSNSANVAAIFVKSTPTVSPTLIAEATPSSTATPVTITAVDGDLAIRTGPDITFDAVARLKNGETATVVARSIIDGWLEIEIPSQPEKTGWVSTQTHYSFTSGNTFDLPRIDQVEWIVGSYLRNCTAHRMLVLPSEKILSPVSDTDGNQYWFTSGLYTVYDLDVAGQPVVAHLKVVEHRVYNIRKDGSGQQVTCPQN